MLKKFRSLSSLIIVIKGKYCHEMAWAYFSNKEQFFREQKQQDSIRDNDHSNRRAMLLIHLLSAYNRNIVDDALDVVLGMES